MAEEVASTSTALRARQPVARLRAPGVDQPATGDPEPILDPLLTSRTIPAPNHPAPTLAIPQRAYVVAEEAHRGQVRKSGDPCITHPLAVAMILAELGMTPVTLAAALLHDVVEDTDYPLAEIDREFRPEVAHIRGERRHQTRQGQVREIAQAQTVRKMIVAMAGDIRVLVIKLADRLHNARTWGSVCRSRRPGRRRRHSTSSRPWPTGSA